jgi:ABC-2 type transport system permease protein
MIGILAKSMREGALGTLLIGLGFAGVAILFNLIIPDLQSRLVDLWAGVPFFQTMIGALMGVRIDEGTSGRVFLTIIWTHPIVLALLAAHVVTWCTRFPAGEIDRGTIDVLLSLPVSRTRIAIAETGACILSGLLVLLIGLAGYWIGARFVEPASRLAPKELGLILLNLACLYGAVGGGAMMVSAAGARRGRAIGIIVGVLLASFLWTFLAPLWAPARSTAFLSVLDYYRPAQIVMRSTLAWRDPLVLVAAGVTMWAIGLVILKRRDIATT